MFLDQGNVCHQTPILLKLDLVQPINIFRDHPLRIFAPGKVSLVSFELTKLDNCVRCNLPLTDKLPVRGAALKYSKQYLSHRVGNILRNIFVDLFFVKKDKLQHYRYFLRISLN